MAFVSMKVGDANNDKVIWFDTERFSQFWILYNGVEITGINPIGDNSDFFWTHTDVFGVEIFDGFGVGEVSSHQGLGQPFEDTGDEVFLVIVGGAEKRNNRGIRCTVKCESANHIGMEEIGQYNIRIFLSDQSPKTENTWDIEEAGGMYCLDYDTGRDKLRCQFAKFL